MVFPCRLTSRAITSTTRVAPWLGAACRGRRRVLGLIMGARWPAVEGQAANQKKSNNDGGSDAFLFPAQWHAPARRPLRSAPKMHFAVNFSPCLCTTGAPARTSHSTTAHTNDHHDARSEQRTNPPSLTIALALFAALQIPRHATKTTAALAISTNCWCVLPKALFSGPTQRPRRQAHKRTDLNPVHQLGRTAGGSKFGRD